MCQLTPDVTIRMKRLTSPVLVNDNLESRETAFKQPVRDSWEQVLAIAGSCAWDDGFIQHVSAQRSFRKRREQLSSVIVGNII